MKKIVKYVLVSDMFTSDLEQKVNQFISKNYQPYGRPFTNHEGYIFQTMVIYEGDVEKD